MKSWPGLDGVLKDEGFAIVPGPFCGPDLHRAIAAFTDANAAASPDEIQSGSTSVRIGGLLQRAPCLAHIFTHKPLLSAAADLIGGPFKLSAFHARNVRPGAAAQPRHQDVAPGQDGWPLLGFIFMVDAFEAANGATRFLQPSVTPDKWLNHPDERFACGMAGSMILFDGSVWHGHGANRTAQWRRSAQGALIPADATDAIDHRSQLSSEAWWALPATARAVISGLGA